MFRIILLAALVLDFPVHAAPSSGERLAYVVGCINCHHQTPKAIMPAPPLTIVKAYSLDEFKYLLRTGITRDGRTLLEKSSLMGIVATEQLSFLTEEEMTAIYEYLRNEWTPEKAAAEEAKIPRLYKNAPTGQ
jgi:mono/diheme cytochrome c family protein